MPPYRICSHVHDACHVHIAPRPHAPDAPDAPDAPMPICTYAGMLGPYALNGLMSRMSPHPLSARPCDPVAHLVQVKEVPQGWQR